MPAQRIVPDSGSTGSNRISASLRSGFAPSTAFLISASAPRGERVAQAGIAAAEPLVQGDDAVAGHRAEALLAVGNIAREFHCRDSIYCP